MCMLNIVGILEVTSYISSSTMLVWTAINDVRGIYAHARPEYVDLVTEDGKQLCCRCRSASWSKASLGNSEYRVILNTSRTMLRYFSSIDNWTPVLHIQVGLGGSFLQEPFLKLQIRFPQCTTTRYPASSRFPRSFTCRNFAIILNTSTFPYGQKVANQSYQWCTPWNYWFARSR